MSREILFRGKRIKTGKWGYGDLIRAKGKTFVGGEEEDIFWMEAEVYPGTVGQFTGLCDKNGVKVFEGDILRDGLGDDGIVTYFESIASFKYRVGNEVWNLNEGDPNRPTQLQYTEVIGNIHDNPEYAKEESK